MTVHPYGPRVRGTPETHPEAGIESGQRYPLPLEKIDPNVGSLVDILFKINDLVERSNQQETSIQTLNVILKGVEGRVKSSGFRPLHIEDGQVQEESAFNVIQGEVVPPRCEHSYVTINNGAHLWERCENCGQCINKRRPSCTCSHLYGGISYNASCPLHSRTASVPEAEPQKQDKQQDLLIKAIDEFWMAVVSYEDAKRDPMRIADVTLRNMHKKRDDLIAAAHSEYAQPKHSNNFYEGMAAHRYVRERWEHRYDAWHRVTEGSADQQVWTVVLDEVKPEGPPAAQPGKGV